MAVSKVVLGNQTVMDITDSTVDAGSLLAGKKAYGANGEAVNGSLVISDRIRWNEARTSVKKNLIPNKFTTTEINGLTFTKNSDGSITINGTATARTTISIIPSANGMADLAPLFALGELTISGTGISSSKCQYNLYLHDLTVGHKNFGNYASERTVDFSDYAGNVDDCNFSFIALNGSSYDNETIYPMIRLASIEDDTYVPYIPDNVELDEKKANISSLANVATSGSYGDLSNKPDLQIESKFISAYGNVGRDANTVLDNSLCYASANTPPTSIGGYSDGSMSLISQRRNNSWTAQIAQRYDTGEMFVRGQASGTWSSWKRVSTEFYLDQSVTLSTSDDTTVTFTNANIHADSAVEPWASVYGLVASNVVTTEGQCVVTFPKQDTAQSMTCRIYIK